MSNFNAAGPDLFRWSPEFGLGIPTVDLQHRRLVELINQVARQRADAAGNLAIGATLNELASYTRLHFQTEADLMTAAGLDPDYRVRHAVAHAEFLTQVEVVVQDGSEQGDLCVEKLLALLVFWLVVHVLGEDKEMARLLAARGSGGAAEPSLAPSPRVMLEAFHALYAALTSATSALTAAQTKLRQSMEAQLQVAQRLTKIGSFEVDWPTRRVRRSAEIFRIWEREPAQVDPTYQGYLGMVHPEDREQVDLAFTGAMAAGTHFAMSHRLLLADGRIKYVQATCETEYSGDGQPLRSVGTLHDITASVGQTLALKEAQKTLRTVADYTYDWEYWVGADGEMVYVSPSCQRITGYSAEEFLEDPELALRIVHPDDRDAFDHHQRGEESGLHSMLDFRVVRRDGRVVWISHACQRVDDGRGGSLGRRASNRDITERKLLEEELLLRATSDYLTRLANRRHFIERATQELARSVRHGRPLALLMLDIDLFKQINDLHGHQEGDRALQMVASRCQMALRQMDVVGRFGGEEFALLLVEANLEGGVSVAERLRRDIAEQELQIRNGTAVRLTVSIGVAAWTSGQKSTVAELLREADDALYAAKALGRNRVCTRADVAARETRKGLGQSDTPEA